MHSTIALKMTNKKRNLYGHTLKNISKNNTVIKKVTT